MSNKVLFVDDEQNILDTFRVTLRKRFEVTIALGPEEGVKMVQGQGPFAVVVSDLKMPKMDGITFLTVVRDLAPDTVRVMLTGMAEVEAAIRAVNEGSVFRFLTKPCPIEVLVKSLEAALKQHKLVTAEKELLRGTLRGCIRVLTEALSLANPEAYGRSQRVKKLVSRMAQAVGAKVSWELDLAAMLSHIGCMALPRRILEELSAGRELSAEDFKLYNTHPTVGVGLLEHIPRLEAVTAIIAEQNKDLHPQQPDGARYIKIAADYDLLASKGIPPREALDKMFACRGCYETRLLEGLEKSLAEEGEYARKRVFMRELTENMILDQDVVTSEGLLLLAKGAELNESIILRLVQARKAFDILEPVAVLLPAGQEAAQAPPLTA
jgi:response regulator RpfG family c-di-GMP phosphodiesterase